MNDLAAITLTFVLAMGVLAWVCWVIWRIAQARLVQGHALTHVLGVAAGTVTLGVVRPAAMMGGADPFRIWLVYAVLLVIAAIVLGWRWVDLESQRGSHSARAFSVGVFMAVLAMAAIAAT